MSRAHVEALKEFLRGRWFDNHATMSRELWTLRDGSPVMLFAYSADLICSVTGEEMGFEPWGSFPDLPAESITTGS